jgi:murein DD-endopeptidase MepM/ murein hydrolase activator NlpD
LDLFGLVTQAQVLNFTPIQHNYPSNPLPKYPCWVSGFFDDWRVDHYHKAEDVVYDDGTGKKGVTPQLGDPVYAMEAGAVVDAPGTNGPAPEGWPACNALSGHHAGNYVKIKSDSDGYYTIYFHVNPSVSKGQHVNQGQLIGVLDNSGCQKAPHLHVQRKDLSNVPVNFTLPCTNDVPKYQYSDGLVNDYVDANL